MKDYFECIKKDNWTGFDEDKAKVAAIVSILRPGKTNTASISSDNWISLETTKDVTGLQKLDKFLDELLS